jgi:histidinol-phosphate/aromatic aminotransferase/cobyric acid decarboxylase-like protein
MGDTNEDTAEELLERGRVLREEAQELLRIAVSIREQAQKLMDQVERTARILAANKAGRVK